MVSVASGSPWGIGEFQDTVRQHTAFVWRGSLCRTNPMPFDSGAHLHQGCAFYGAKVGFCSLPSGSCFRLQDTGNCPSFRFFPELVFCSLRRFLPNSHPPPETLALWRSVRRCPRFKTNYTVFRGHALVPGSGKETSFGLCVKSNICCFFFFFEGIRVPIPPYGRIQTTVSFLLVQRWASVSGSSKSKK